MSVLLWRAAMQDCGCVHEDWFVPQVMSVVWCALKLNKKKGGLESILHCADKNPTGAMA